jgi:hypothetical protein
MNNFHNSRDERTSASPPRPPQPRPAHHAGELRNRIRPPTAATDPFNHSRLCSPFQLTGHHCTQNYAQIVTTAEFLINGQNIRIHRKQLKTNNSTRF